MTSDDTSAIRHDPYSLISDMAAQLAFQDHRPGWSALKAFLAAELSAPVFGMLFGDSEGIEHGWGLEIQVAILSAIDPIPDDPETISAQA